MSTWQDQSFPADERERERLEQGERNRRQVKRRRRKPKTDRKRRKVENPSEEPSRADP